MIEFKGECGHIIRARDEDAGKLVRCSYCGTESLVAPAAGGEIEGLMGEMERTGTYDSQATKAQRKQHRTQVKEAARQAGAADPFEVIKKMILVAAALVLMIVGWKFAVNVIRELPTSQQRAVQPSPHPGDGGTPSGPTDQPANSTGRPGLLSMRLDPQQQGVYVTSVPSQLSVYAVSSWDGHSSIMAADGANMNVRTNSSVRFSSGKQYIAVAVRLNHPFLMDIPGFPDLRRRIEADDYSEYELTSFFETDESTDTRVERRGASQFLLRVFEVDVPRQGWRQVTALFVPVAPIQSLLAYLPKRQNYSFDVATAQRELKFYQVPAQDHDAMIQALQKIGTVVYVPPDGGPHRTFRIDLEDGMLSSYESLR